MKILKIIHGYPPLYNAGSEVYSQLLCHGLGKRHEVHVFTREENPFAKNFSLRVSHDTLEPAIKLHIINIPGEKFRYRYRHAEVDKRLIHLIDEIKPAIVHIGHLNHLSTSFIPCLSKLNIPIVYTMHDYWIMCPRGQFIQRNPENCTDIWALCDGQSHKKCAERCYAGYFSGASDEKAIDVEYWYKWVERRMTHLRDITQYIDCFIAPSQYLRNRFIHEFGISEDKIVYLDYGFDLQRLKKRKPIKNKHFTFGYIGTHTPAKGIQHLISAFSLLRGDCQLIIWGRPRPQNTDGLKINISNLPLAVQNNIAWRSEYQNNNIVEDVFNHVDCIVVPSIWVENSPLVIHEALQMRLPVITANIGGMAEYVQHEKNGLLFEHRDYQSLAKQMQRLIDHPALARKLGARGYLQSDDANIQDLTEHTASVEAIYHRLMDKT